MLNYGAYSQLYFNIDTDSLPNSDCAYTNELEFTAPLSEVVIQRVSGSGTIKASLVLDTTIAIRVYKNGTLIGEKTGLYTTDLDTVYTAGKIAVRKNGLCCGIDNQPVFGQIPGKILNIHRIVSQTLECGQILIFPGGDSYRAA